MGLHCFSFCTCEAMRKIHRQLFTVRVHRLERVQCVGLIFLFLALYSYPTSDNKRFLKKNIYCFILLIVCLSVCGFVEVHVVWPCG